MNRRRPGLADTLLSQGNLSGAQREELLDHVLDGVRGAERSTRRSAFMGIAAALAVSAALVLFWVRPRETEGLRAKGDGTPAGATSVVVSCEPGGLSACAPGGTLVFAVERAPPAAHLAAYAEPVAGGERIWYFSAEGESPVVDDQTSDAILRRGIRLGPEHAPGRYRLTLLLTRTPLPRPALLSPHDAPGVLLTQHLEFTVAP